MQKLKKLITNNYFKRIFFSLIFMLILVPLFLYFGIEGYARQYIYEINKAPKADAIIVPGALVFKSGNPSEMLRDRLNYAIKLYENKNAAKILVSGDHGTKEYDEVNAMRAYLLKKGIPSNDIFMDHAGFDTYDTLYRAKEIFLIKKAIVVTQDFHLRRALYIGKELDLDIVGVASDPYEYYGIFYNKTREVFSRSKAFLDAEILKSKPKYLGETIPIWSNAEKTLDKK